MCLDKKEEKEKEKYSEMLKLMGSLSRLFSENKVPYLHYRVAENLFCKQFNAENLSRFDCSVDAKKGTLGIGIKTFIKNNGKTFQKIAEFNKDRNAYAHETTGLKESIHKIVELRNMRLEATKTIYGLEELIYHCVVRDDSKILVYEEKMDMIDEKEIKDINKNKNIITFKDNKNDYQFNISKSTLYKRFTLPKNYEEIDIEIINDPFMILEKLTNVNKENTKTLDKLEEVVYLPLYSTRGKNVSPKSGLNQWNAGGRKRKDNEVYIPIPAWVHKRFPNFFNLKIKNFDVHLPNGKILNMSVCQEGRKTLMSNPNKDLGIWILRNILKVSPGEIVTINHLLDMNIDSVELKKINDEEYILNFSKYGSYESFEKHYNIKSTN